MSQLWIVLLQVYSLMGLLSLFFLWKSCFRQKSIWKPTKADSKNKKQRGGPDNALQQIQKARAHKVASDQQRVQQLTNELASLKAMQTQVREQLSVLKVRAMDKKDEDHPPLKTD